MVLENTAALFFLGVVAATAPPRVPEPAKTPQLTKMPVLVRYTEAAYPPDAKAQSMEGEVILKLVVDELGRVAAVQVAQSAGAAFDDAATTAAWRFIFEPAEVDGVPAPVQIEYRTLFRLKEEPPPRPLESFAGEVRDIETDQPLPGATVFLPDLDLTAETGPDGRFSFTALPAGAHPVKVVAFDHEMRVTSVTTDTTSVANAVYRLSRSARAVYETKVIARRLREEVRRKPVALEVRPVVSEYQLTKRDVELTPGALEDVSRVVQSLPGVVGDPDLMATFFVRGGDADEVLFYLDGMPLSNPYHLGGFATIFNPELIRSISFFAGGQPAPYRSSLSGSLDIGYLAGQADRYEGVADVSANTAKVMVAGPTPVPGLSLMLSARRSYFELYFMLLKELHIVGQRFVAPDIGEYEAKATYRTGKHRVDVAFVQATDGLNFIGSKDDGSLFVFEGGLRTQNNLSLVHATWQWDPSDALHVKSLLGYARDRSEAQRTSTQEAGETSSLISSANTLFDDVVWRTDADWRTHGENHLRAGVDLDVWREAFSGRVEDTRAVPRWIATPLADYHRATLDIAPVVRRVELGVYVEDEWKDLLPRLTPRVGLRCDFVQGMAGPMLSPRLALSYRLFEPTVIKAAWGLYQKTSRNPLELDPLYGNPHLKPERAFNTIVGLEQLLPFKTLLRVEGYYKDLKDLIVNPDDPARVAQGTTFTNDGFGWAWGGDALLLHRGEHLGFGLSYGFLRTERTNPLNMIYEKTYVPQQAQTHTFGASVDYSLGDTWVFALKYLFHVGRPYTTIGGWHVEERDGKQVYVPELGSNGKLDDGRLSDSHDLSARVEYWIRRPSWRATIYAEVLNLTNSQPVFMYTYDAGDPVTGTLPKRGEFNHLPIRPFLGIRGEY